MLGSIGRSGDRLKTDIIYVYKAVSIITIYNLSTRMNIQNEA